jgi:hypothetical protein
VAAREERIARAAAPSKRKDKLRARAEEAMQASIEAAQARQAKVERREKARAAKAEVLRKNARLRGVGIVPVEFALKGLRSVPGATAAKIAEAVEAQAMDGFVRRSTVSEILEAYHVVRMPGGGMRHISGATPQTMQSAKNHIFAAKRIAFAARAAGEAPDGWYPSVDMTGIRGRRKRAKMGRSAAKQEMVSQSLTLDAEAIEDAREIRAQLIRSQREEAFERSQLIIFRKMNTGKTGREEAVESGEESQPGPKHSKPRREREGWEIAYGGQPETQWQIPKGEAWQRPAPKKDLTTCGDVEKNPGPGPGLTREDCLEAIYRRLESILVLHDRSKHDLGGVVGMMREVSDHELLCAAADDKGAIRLAHEAMEAALLLGKEYTLNFSKRQPDEPQAAGLAAEPSKKPSRKERAAAKKPPLPRSLAAGGNEPSASKTKQRDDTRKKQRLAVVMAQTPMQSVAPEVARQEIEEAQVAAATAPEQPAQAIDPEPVVQKEPIVPANLGEDADDRVFTWVTNTKDHLDLAYLYDFDEEEVRALESGNHIITPTPATIRPLVPAVVSGASALCIMTSPVAGLPTIVAAGPAASAAAAAATGAVKTAAVLTAKATVMAAGAAVVGANPIVHGTLAVGALTYFAYNTCSAVAQGRKIRLWRDRQPTPGARFAAMMAEREAANARDVAKWTRQDRSCRTHYLWRAQVIPMEAPNPPVDVRPASHRQLPLKAQPQPATLVVTRYEVDSAKHWGQPALPEVTVTQIDQRLLSESWVGSFGDVREALKVTMTSMTRMRHINRSQMPEDSEADVLQLAIARVAHHYCRNATALESLNASCGKKVGSLSQESLPATSKRN